MKKVITISVVFLFILISPFCISAQAKQSGQAGAQQQDRLQDPTTHEEGTAISASEEPQQSPAAGNRGIEKAAKNLNRVTQRNNNPETGEQVRSMVQSHQKIQARTKTALNQMNQRNQAIKFLIGPDYKNAGQVRSDVVGLRNDIRKLDQIKEDFLPTDTEDIQGAIDELQIEANGLETQLAEQLSGFSLFGWLSKLLAK